MFFDWNLEFTVGAGPWVFELFSHFFALFSGCALHGYPLMIWYTAITQIVIMPMIARHAIAFGASSSPFLICRIMFILGTLLERVSRIP